MLKPWSRRRKIRYIISFPFAMPLLVLFLVIMGIAAAMEIAGGLLAKFTLDKLCKWRDSDE